MAGFKSNFSTIVKIKITSLVNVVSVPIHNEKRRKIRANKILIINYIIIILEK